MHLMNIVHTMNALGAIAMILIGSSWLKCWLRGSLRGSCPCRWEKE